MEKISKDEYVMALGIVTCYEKENGVNTHHQAKQEYDEPTKDKEEEKELEDKG